MDNRFSHIRVALDGPSGAGKSTIAKEVAKRTGLIYVDTGALYRTVGLYAAEHGISADDTDGIISCLPHIEIKLAYEDGAQKVYLNGSSVGDKIRTENASYYASAVSKIPEVRAFLLGIQKKLADEGGVIMDGRIRKIRGCLTGYGHSGRAERSPGRRACSFCGDIHLSLRKT